MDGNKYLSGSEGQVWVNAELWGEVKSIDFKVTGKFEEVISVGDQSSHQKYTGWNGEGTLTLNKAYSRGITEIAKGFKTGQLPEFTIITKVTNKQSGQSERWSLSELVFTELSEKFEAKGILTQEMPFKFADFDILDTINAN